MDSFTQTLLITKSSQYQCIYIIHPTFSFSIATKEMAKPILHVWKGRKYDEMIVL